MKKSILLVFIFLFLLCACQPTPTESIVVGKDQSKMLEQAMQPIPSDQQAMTIRERLGVPEHLKYSYKKGNLTIDADAKVLVPDAELPILRVFPSDFDQATVTSLWNTLIGDMPMTAINYARTKADISESIEWLMNEIDSGDVSKYGFASEEEAKQALKSLQKQYKEAPDLAMGDPVDGTLQRGVALDDDGREVAFNTYLNAESKEAGYRFTVSNNWSNKEAIITKVYDEFGKEIGTGTRTVSRDANFTFIKSNEPQASCYIWGDELRFSDSNPEQMNGSVTITPQQARTFVEDFLAASGFSDTFTAQRIFLITDSDATQYAYRVVCMRTVNGASVLMSGNTHETEFTVTPDGDEEYAEYWDYEQFLLDVNDGGVYCIQFQSPLSCIDFVTKQTNLLPFAEIEKIMKKMLPIKYETEAINYGDDSMELRYEKHINRVELGLWRVREQNSIERGLLIPVWAFYANTSECDQTTGYTYDTYLPILLVNAIDGSIIDPEKGY